MEGAASSGSTRPSPRTWTTVAPTRLSAGVTRSRRWQRTGSSSAHMIEVLRSRAPATSSSMPALFEVGRLRAAVVVDAAVGAVVLGAIRAPAELAPEEDVLDRVVRECLRESSLPDLRCPLRHGMRAHVHKHRDLLRAQQRDDLLRGVARVADAVDGRHRRYPYSQRDSPRPRFRTVCRARAGMRSSSPPAGRWTFPSISNSTSPSTTITSSSVSCT